MQGEKERGENGTEDGERKRRREKERKRDRDRVRKRERKKDRRHSKEREEESPARVEAADGQTLRDPQAGVFELRPLCRLPLWWKGKGAMEEEVVVRIGVEKRRKRERGW